MRAHALEQGFTLNEYSLRPLGTTGKFYYILYIEWKPFSECIQLQIILGVPGEPVEITSEKDIFDCIEYPYKNPEERNS